MQRVPALGHIGVARPDDRCSPTDAVSQAFESVQESRGVRKRHEQWTAAIIGYPSDRVRRLLEGYRDGLSEDVAALLRKEDPEDIYRAVVAGSFDADRLDYLRRDKLMTGTGAGGIDFDWLIENVRVADVAIAPRTRTVAKATGLRAEHPLTRPFAKGSEMEANSLALDDSVVLGALGAMSQATHREAFLRTRSEAGQSFSTRRPQSASTRRSGAMRNACAGGCTFSMAGHRRRSAGSQLDFGRFPGVIGVESNVIERGIRG